MSRFELAYEFLKPWEAGDVNHPSDPGGATRDGVSLRWLRSIDHELEGLPVDVDKDNDGDLTPADIWQLTDGDVRTLFEHFFWDDQMYYWFNSQDVADRAFSFAVNMGVRQAGRVVQRAINAAYGDTERLVVDGRVGRQTIKAANSIDPFAIVVGIRAEAWHVYRWIMMRKPETEDFKDGWHRRAYA